MSATKLVTYEVYQRVETVVRSDDIKIFTATCPGSNEESVARFEARLKPRIEEYSQRGTITVIRQTREEVLL